MVAEYAWSSSKKWSDKFQPDQLVAMILAESHGMDILWTPNLNFLFY